MKKGFFFRFVVLAAVLLVSAGSLFADFDYTVEVKLILDSDKVLDPDHVLSAELQSLFAVEKTNERVVLYVDTPDRAFNKGGWTNRIREKAGKKNIEITYKKRFPVVDGDVDAAFAQALREERRLLDGDFEAEIDWGYDKMTLSFSLEEKVAKPEGGLKGMSARDLVDNLMHSMPYEENLWMFVRMHSRQIQQAVIAGPVDYVRYTGSYKDVEMDIEVWQLPDGQGGMRYVTELSFGGDSIEEVSPLRDELMALLDGKGVLMHESSLKTSMILDAFIN